MSTGLIVALDDPDLDRAEELASRLEGKVAALKVGLTLFTAHGPEALRRIGRYAPIFCDAKLHDIPQQVLGAAREIGKHGVWLFTAHASGGPEMIASAVEGAGESDPAPIVAAVTVLTSLGDQTLEAVGQGLDTSAQVLRLAALALEAGAGALVCSPLEVAALRSRFGAEPILVVPGVRPSGSSSGDQVRVMTPSETARAGASYAVVGRPITGDPDPVAAAEKIAAELEA